LPIYTNVFFITPPNATKAYDFHTELVAIVLGQDEKKAILVPICKWKKRRKSPKAKRDRQHLSVPCSVQSTNIKHRSETCPKTMSTRMEVRRWMRSPAAEFEVLEYRRGSI
jgi:hypothetical protein